MIVERGPDDYSTLDWEKGAGFGPNGRQFIIDKDTLDELSVVKEGELSETQGAATLRLVADIPTAIREVTVKVNRDIDKHMVVYTFLDQAEVNDPKSFISAICKHEVTYAPIYYYAHLAGFTRSECQNFMTRRSPS